MSIKVFIQNKPIIIYYEYGKENIELPIVFYDTFSGDGDSVWEKCKKIKTYRRKPFSINNAKSSKSKLNVI